MNIKDGYISNQSPISQNFVISESKKIRDSLQCFDDNEKIDKDSYLAKINEVFQSSPLLKIEISNSSFKTSIQLNPYGMISGSLRNQQDGYTYFGYQSPDNSVQSIDFLLKPPEEGLIEKYVGRQFRVRFVPETKKYSVRDLGCGNGTFGKVVGSIKIEDSYLINIGNLYLVFVYENEDGEANDQNFKVDDKILIIKVFMENKKDEHRLDSNIKTKYYIGRDKDCDVPIEDSFLSRIHCTVQYRGDKGWFLIDGKLEDNDSDYKPSTNGSWQYLMEDTEIRDGMIFRGCDSLFECHYYQE